MEFASASKRIPPLRYFAEVGGVGIRNVDASAPGTPSRSPWHLRYTSSALGALVGFANAI